jgi:hypothetical protein
MSQLNTNPDTSTYIVGRGKMYFADILADNTPGVYRFVGNCPEVTATVESETYEHFRSTQGLRIKDLDIVLQTSINWSAALENMDEENLQIFFAASVDALYSNPAITGFTDATLVADGDMKSAATGGGWYQIVDADGEPVAGIDKANLTLSSTNGTPVVLTDVTDYVTMEDTGMVYFNDTVPIQTIISGSEGVTATMAADAGASVLTKLGAGSAGETNVAIKFDLINAQTDAVEVSFFLHKAGVTANGDAGFISDEVAQLPITIAVEANDGYDNVMDIIDHRG